MIRGLIIERLSLSKQGGWEGNINTLAIQHHARLVPNDDRHHENAPAFRVMLGWQHISDDWEQLAHGERARPCFKVAIEDSVYPLNARLFPDHKGATALMPLSPTRRKDALALEPEVTNV